MNIIAAETRTYSEPGTGEVTAIRRRKPAGLILHLPETEKGREELALRVSDIHAASIVRRLKSLDCPAIRKQELLEAVIREIKTRNIAQN